MTTSELTPGARDAADKEYTESWGIDPSVHASDENGDQPSEDADAKAARRATMSEYEQAHEDLEDAEAARDDASAEGGADDADESANGDADNADGDDEGAAK